MIQRDKYLQVVSMSAEAAKTFFGRTDEPVDLGLPPDPKRHKEGARVWGFLMVTKIDRIDGKGNIREHLTEDGKRTLCGLDIHNSQAACGNKGCKRCVALAARRQS